MKSVFISHVGEEAALASAIKGAVIGTFPDSVEVFVSSDSDSIRPGEKWLERISSAIENAAVMLVLCSSESISRPWVNFEAGCGWSRRIPIIPVCYAGVSKATLPAPLSNLHALDLAGPDSVKALLQAVGAHLGCTLPRVDFAALGRDVLAHVPKAMASQPVATAEEKDGLEDIDVLLLQGLARLGERTPNAYEMAKLTNSDPVTIEYHLEELKRKGFVHDLLFFNQPRKFGLTHPGRAYLVKNGLLAKQ